MKFLIIFYLLISYPVHSKMKYNDYFNYMKEKLEYSLKENNCSKDTIKFKTIKIAVIDTGVNKSNPILNKNIHRNIASNKNFGYHGSHIQGILQMISPESKIIHYNFYNKNALKSENQLNFVKAISEAIKDNVNIINISGGGFGYSKKEVQLLKIARKKGIIIVSAAGNNETNLDEKSYKKRFFPASYNLPNIISVTNYETKSKIYFKSNYGKKTITLGVNGVKTLSFCNSNLPCYATGSSQATPIITGVIANILMRYLYISLSKIKHILKINSHKDKFTKMGYFDYSSFTSWMNNNFNYLDIMNKVSLNPDNMFYLYSEIVNQPFPKKRYCFNYL